MARPDANANGIIDEYDENPNVLVISSPLGSFGEDLVIDTTLDEMPDASGNVTLEVVGYGDFSTGSEFATISLGDGLYVEDFFISSPGDCYSPREIETVVLDAELFNALNTESGMRVQISGTGSVNPALCTLGNQVTLRLSYRGCDFSSQGNPGSCAGTCLADLNADGVIDFSDINLFTAAFQTGDPAADLSGDGSVGFEDLNLFVAAFSAGCP